MASSLNLFHNSITTDDGRHIIFSERSSLVIEESPFAIEIEQKPQDKFTRKVVSCYTFLGLVLVYFVISLFFFFFLPQIDVHAMPRKHPHETLVLQLKDNPDAGLSCSPSYTRLKALYQVANVSEDSRFESEETNLRPYQWDDGSWEEYILNNVVLVDTPESLQSMVYHISQFTEIAVTNFCLVGHSVLLVSNKNNNELL